jgi:PAS domain S-box-containing protein
MRDERKTKKQLVEELSALRRRVAALEGSEVPAVDEEHFRLMVEVAPVAIMGIRNGCFLSVNPAGSQMLGFSDPQEMVGMSALEVIASESQPEIVEGIKRLENGLDNPPVELTLIRQDGMRIKAESTSASISIDGIPTAVIIAQDITERKENEKRLQMMQFSIDHALDRIAWIAPDGRFLYANEPACKEMGYTLNEVLSMSVSDVDPNFPSERWAEHCQEVRKRGFMRLETQQISDDGETHDVEVSSNWLKFGEYEFMCSFARDITERRQLEVKLKESEERFRAFMDNNPASIYIKDENDRHIYGNPAAFKSVRKKPDEFIGSTTQDLWPPQLADKLIESDRKVIDEGIPRITEEWSSTEKGEVRWLRDIKFPIKLGSGKKLLGGIAIDITAIKESEQELRNAYSEIKRLKQKLEHENIYLREEIKLEHQHESFIGKSDVIRGVLSQAEEVSKTDSTVLILGETGTGKELLAREIHKMSARKDGPLVNVNCASLPPTLIESELFGREKGAYTGALSKQVGRFEIADGSSIFLDEIGELPMELQAKLLRILHEGEFERLGSPKTITVDVRIIAATNRDLEKAVEEGRFREDLYYRLHVYPIEIPPLREHLEDIDPLVWAFVREFGERMGKKIDRVPRESLEALKRYDWPGNVRELKNSVERAMIMTKGTILKIDKPLVKSNKSSRIETWDALQRKHILKALEMTGGRVSGKNGAAAMLQINPKTLESKMKNLGIKRKGSIS